jgi:cell division septum initiation protein DivIVA
LVAGLVAGLSVTDAAEKASMARTAAYAALKRPEVRDRVSQASAEMTSAAARKAATLVSGAISVLDELAHGAQSEGVRRQAASDLLSAARAFRTDQEVEEKMASLSAELDAIVQGVARVAA